MSAAAFEPRRQSPIDFECDRCGAKQNVACMNMTSDVWRPYYAWIFHRSRIVTAEQDLLERMRRRNQMLGRSTDASC